MILLPSPNPSGSPAKAYNCLTSLTSSRTRRTFLWQSLSLMKLIPSSTLDTTTLCLGDILDNNFFCKETKSLESFEVLRTSAKKHEPSNCLNIVL
ncbi:hypothetical protein EUGRSUZ_H02121 [Eucalyptus grandis]|uniref:Uncharacterized protein n=2 Tax=Eucalyptus grandis TaxID=71139 RepID=A0ACC3JQW4_EUCGR|nr:hypothetical protein EUGRSUZ_H02121 [Eucalyptus grandis]